MRGKKVFSYIFFTLLFVIIVVSIRSVYTERSGYKLIVQHESESLQLFGSVLAAVLDTEDISNPAFSQKLCKQYGRYDTLRIAFLDLGKALLCESGPPFEGESVTVLVPLIDVENREIGYLELERPLEERREETRRIINRNYVITLLLVFIAAVVGFFIVRSFYKPISSLRDAAVSYGKRDFTFDPSVEKPEEMRVLSETMKEMADALRSRIQIIEQQRNELEMILTSMVESVIVLDTHLVIRKINKAGLELINKKREEVENKSLIEIFRNSELYEFATQILLSPGPRETSISIFSSSPGFLTNEEPFSEKGKKLYLQVQGSSIQSDEEDGFQAAVLLVLHDITKLKILENMRKDFVANVSHELKTPITSIKGFVETLLDGAAKDPDKAVRFLEIINKHTNRLNRIIDDLLSLSRLEQYENIELEFKEFSLASLIARAVTVCSSRARLAEIPIEVDAAEEITAYINPQLIEQALVNLIDNAVKYSDPGCIVRIVLNEENEHISISVIDNGCGIPPESQDRVFERFYRVDRARSRDLGGTGLGLAIVKHIAFAHNGEAHVQSEPGKGSTFTIVLPKEQITQVIDHSPES